MRRSLTMLAVVLFGAGIAAARSLPSSWIVPANPSSIIPCNFVAPGGGTLCNASGPEVEGISTSDVFVAVIAPNPVTNGR